MSKKEKIEELLTELNNEADEALYKCEMMAAISKKTEQIMAIVREM